MGNIEMGCNVEFCTIHHTIKSVKIDGDDADRDPDIMPVSGRVVFTPLLGKGDAVVITNPDGEASTLNLEPITASIQGGVLMHRGEPGVRLFAGGEGVSNPPRIRYRATFQNLVSGTSALQLKDILFEAVPSGEVQLSVAQPVPGQPYPGLAPSMEEALIAIADARIEVVGLLTTIRDDVQQDAARAEAGADRVGTAEQVGVWAAEAQEGAARVGTAEQVGVWATQAENAATATNTDRQAVATDRQEVSEAKLEVHTILDTLGGAQQLDTWVNEAKQAAVTTSADKAAVATDRTVVEQAAQQVAGDAQQVADDAQQVATDRQVVEQAEAAVAGKSVQVSSDAGTVADNTATVVGLAAQVAGDAQQVTDDRQVVSQAETTVTGAATQVSLDAQQVATDRQAVGQARDDAVQAKNTASGHATTATQQATEAGLAAYRAEQATASKADLIGGKVPSSQIPEVALTKPFPVTSRAEMLALDAQEGDVAIITGGTDQGSYILGEGPSTNFESWILLSAGSGGVQSVNGQTGTVNLGAADVGAAKADHTHSPSSIGAAPSVHQHTAEQITDLQEKLDDIKAFVTSSIEAWGNAIYADMYLRPAFYSGDGPPPAEIPGSVVGDIYFDKTSQEVYIITEVNP